MGQPNAGPFYHFGLPVPRERRNRAGRWVGTVVTGLLADGQASKGPLRLPGFISAVHVSPSVTAAYNLAPASALCAAIFYFVASRCVPTQLM
jgi:hypothetical protein